MNDLIARFFGWFNDRALKRVIKNSSYLMLSNVISIFLTIYITRLLGVYDYGVLGLITSYVTNVNKLFSFRMNEVVIHFVSEAYEQRDLRKTGALIVFTAAIETISSLAAFLFLALTAKFGAKIFLHDEQLYRLIIVYGLTILSGFAMETANGVLRVINRYRAIAFVNLAQNFLVAILVFYAASAKLGLDAILFSYFLGKVILGLAPVVLTLLWLPKFLGPRWWKNSFRLIKDKKKLLKFTVSTNISSTINLFARDGELLWVGWLLSPLYAGYYKTAMTVINLVLTPVNPLIDTTYPELNRAIAAKDLKEVKRLLSKVTVMSSGWTGLVFIVLAFFGKQLLFYPIFGLPIQVFKTEYAPAYIIIMILMCGYGLANILFWNRTLLLSLGEADYATSVSFYSMLAKTFLTIVLVPRGAYYVEAILLSAYLSISVLIMTYHGLHQIFSRQKIFDEKNKYRKKKERSN